MVSPRRGPHLLYALFSLKTILGPYVAFILFGVSDLTTVVGFVLSLLIWAFGVKVCGNSIPFLGELGD